MRGEDEYEKRKGGGEMKPFDIWIGWYHFGQGYDPPNEPQKVATVMATSFDLACLKHELRSKLAIIDELEHKGKYIDFQTRRWFYDWDNNRNSWTGRYFETREEAIQSFK